MRNADMPLIRGSLPCNYGIADSYQTKICATSIPPECGYQELIDVTFA